MNNLKYFCNLIRLENIYRYKINAFDPNGNQLSYRLDSAPVGVSISYSVL
ncbi:MAG: hypothetical protein LBB88_09940 [Planctomycetaceae bacterium]|nr:hypothetical protein [Planctomycetaceae bacterium]